MKTLAILLVGAGLLTDAVILGQAYAGPGASLSAGSGSSTAPKTSDKASEEAARLKMEKKGYDVGGHILRDEEGLWHAEATKKGKPAHVMVTAQGKVVETKDAYNPAKPMS